MKESKLVMKKVDFRKCQGHREVLVDWAVLQLPRRCRNDNSVTPVIVMVLSCDDNNHCEDGTQDHGSDPNCQADEGKIPSFAGGNFC